ncbi:MAG: PaaI family thioesterase [candidate division NC10 bacterium]
MTVKAFQDYYPDHLSHCYGCGRLNEDGLQIKTFWDGEETITVFQTKPYHIAIPGYVYGGLIASLIDCHCTSTAAAAAYRAVGRPMDSEPGLHFLTAALHKEIKGRKVVVAATLSTNGEICARGEVVAVQVPDRML